MKNLKKIIGMFSIFGFICLNVSFATNGSVNTPAARIREKASTDSEIITKVYEGDEVEILGEEGDWYQVKVNGKTGYVSKSLINISTSTNTTSNTASNSTINNTTTNSVSTYNTEEPKNTELQNIINKDTVLKLLPNFASNELRVLTRNTEVKIEKEINNWVKISLDDNSIGWILKNNISHTKVEQESTEPEENTNTINDTTKTTTDNNTTENNTTKVEDTSNNTTTETTTSNLNNVKGKVNVETANVREKASKSSNIIERLDEGDEVTIVEEEGDWYKITSSKVSSGYISKSLITLSSEEVSSRSQTESREEELVEATNNSTKGLLVVEFAKQYLGASYVSGGKTPETGFDCSGFTAYVFKNFGYSLGATAASQDSVGAIVERADLKPGDLILFLNEGKTKIGHTGIYIGNNEFIHAANPERGVVIDNLETMSYYNERFVTARRIVE